MQELYEIMEQWSKVMETGATPPVDIFPLLKWVPQQWLGNWVDRSVEVGSGMKALYGSFRRRAIEARRQAEQSSQSRARTFVDHVLDLQEKANLTDNQVDFLGGVMMEGGSDSGSTMLLVMIQALVQHPEVQERARAELDAVCGEDRSPTWADFSRLPYINMIVKETMRWRPVTPLSFPHALNQDDWVNGYLLPKGTTVFLNVWGLHHDESVFRNPERFDPSHIHTECGPCKRWCAYYTFPNDANSCDVIGSWVRANGRIRIAYMQIPCWCSSVVCKGRMGSGNAGS
jgi:cytochrome P450